MKKAIRAALCGALVAGLGLHAPRAGATEYTMGYAYSMDYILAQGANAPVGCGCSGSTPMCQITSSAWVYNQGSITNGAKGDALVYQGPGIVSGINIGFIFTHIGLLTYNAQVRHDTADSTALVSAIKLNYNTSFWGQIGNAISLLLSGGYGKVKLDAAQLYNLAPGLTYSQADGGESFGFWRDYAPDRGNTVTWQQTATTPPTAWRSSNFLLKPTTTAQRNDSVAATNWMVSASRSYRLHAYVNLAISNSSGGNVCSGIVASATQGITLTGSTAIPSYTITATDINRGTLNLESFLYNTIRWDYVSPNSPAILGSGDRDGIAHGLVDQVVSCFVYNQPGGCSLMNNTYHNSAVAGTLGAGSAVAPDHIVFSGTTAGKTVGGVLKNNQFSGKNGGPWHNSAVITPSFAGGGWAHIYYGKCVASTGTAG